MKLGRGSSSRDPTSIVGLFLFARARYDAGAADRTGSPTGNPDSFLAMVDAVFDIAVRRRFPEPVAGIRKLTPVVDAVYRIIGSAVAPIEVEAIMRAAIFGDSTVDDIPLDKRGVAKIATYVAIVNGDPRLSDAEVRELLRHAEDIVADRGISLEQARI